MPPLSPTASPLGTPLEVIFELWTVSPMRTGRQSVGQEVWTGRAVRVKDKRCGRAIRVKDKKCGWAIYQSEGQEVWAGQVRREVGILADSGASSPVKKLTRLGQQRAMLTTLR